MEPMPETPEIRAPLAPQRVEGTLLAAAALLALISFFPWHTPLMYPLSAAGMLLAAITFWVSAREGRPWRRYTVLACAGVLVVLGLLGFAGRVHGELISAQAGLGLILLGLQLPISRSHRGAPSLVADLLILVFGIFVLVMLTGSLFRFNSGAGAVSAIRVLPFTLLCFLLYAAVMVMRRSAGGMLAVLRGGGIGSRIVRVAIPLALGLPLLLSLLRSYTVSSGELSPAYASAVSISFISLCVTLLVLLMGRRINRLEQEVRTLLQRSSDERVQESEQRYVELVEQSISGFVVRRPDGHLLLVNEAYRKMTGYSREELLQLSARDLVVDQGVLERVRRLEPGQSAHIETFLKRKDGSLLEVEYVTQRLRDGNLQSVLLDISHRKRLQKQRDEIERRYAELVEQAQEGISVRRHAGEFVFVNDTFCTMLGYSRDELLKLSIHDIVHPGDAHTIAKVQQLGRDERLRLQKRMLRKDGTVIHVEVSARRLRGGDIQSTVQDVTGRKQAEERFRAMVDGSPIAMLMVDRRGVLVLVNPEAERLFGYSRDELIGRSIEMLVPSRYREGHPRLREQYQAAPERRAMGSGRDLHGLRKDGSEVPVEIGLNPMVTAEGQVVLASVIDITERRAAEQRYQELVEQAADAIWLRGPDGRMLFVNDAGCRLLGYSREELLRTASSELLHPTDPDTSVPIDVLQPLQTTRVERIMRHKDGHPIAVEASARRLADGSVQVISHDITERKGIEEELRRMSQRLSEAQETERRAIARELHDEVGQALTATRINLKGLQQQAGDGPLAPRLADSEAVVADLLAKVRQMSLDLHPSVLDDLGLAPALRWCVRTRGVGSDLKVSLDLPEELPRLDHMAEITLFRVFQETLSNVLKHSGAAHLSVRLEYTGERLLMSAKDDGRGFDAEAARQRALSGKSLGLLGMRERARLAGGELVLESVPGQGAEVRVSLPAHAR